MLNENLSPDEVLRNLTKKRREKKLRSKILTARIVLLIIGLLLMITTAIAIYYLYNFVINNPTLHLEDTGRIMVYWRMLIPILCSLVISSMFFVAKKQSVIGLSIGLGFFILQVVVILIGIRIINLDSISLFFYGLIILIVFLIIRGIVAARSLPSKNIDDDLEIIDNL